VVEIRLLRGSAVNVQDIDTPVGTRMSRSRLFHVGQVGAAIRPGARVQECRRARVRRCVHRAGASPRCRSPCPPVSPERADCRTAMGIGRPGRLASIRAVGWRREGILDDNVLVPPSFRRRQHATAPSESPERLFDDLPRTRGGVASLWSHQADILRRYHEQHIETADIALELPTGAGKTLPALLIAEWRRTFIGQRIAYACPNHQLAHQVAGEAARHGLQVVTLVGNHREWPTAARVRYEAARAVAITTYNTVFNVNPALVDPQTLLFDDAHAGEQYVAAAWSISVERDKYEELYLGLVNVLAAELTDLYRQRMLDSAPDPVTRLDARMLPVAAVRRQAMQLDRLLATTTGDLWFRYSMLRARLDKCLLYIAWDGILIRPFIPPTYDHPTFAEAQQRLYLSATLGEGGELERAFGRAPITRLSMPVGWDRRGSGRRYFVFADLTPDGEPRVLTRRLIETAGKALVIAPSGYQLQQATGDLVPQGMPVFGKDHVERSLSTFGEAPTGILALANRYDGMDLPDESCRMVVLDGSPGGGAHLQERFMVRSLRATRVLEERLRTRIVQGAGRCTRGLKDHSLVVVLGEDLARFLGRREVLFALPPELQAEVQFGIENSEVGKAELLELASAFLNQDDLWQTEAEPALADLRREAIVNLPDGTESLATAAAEEVRAWELVWGGDLIAASRAAQELCRHLTPVSLQPYRALWTYLASSWLQAASEEVQDPGLARSARDLLRRAHQLARGTTWLREVQPLPAGSMNLDALDELAVGTIVQSDLRRRSAVKHAELCRELIDSLSRKRASSYERGLATLGSLLGAESFKPPGQGRPDSVWLFGDLWWMTLEAKSEAQAEGLVSMGDVRQANTQLRSLAADRSHEIPSGSVSIIVTPRQLAHPDAVAVADRALYLCTPQEILALARDVVDAWGKLRAAAHRMDDSELASLVRRQWLDHRLLPSYLRERLADRPVLT
jgi:hypothetical protein